MLASDARRSCWCCLAAVALTVLALVAAVVTNAVEDEMGEDDNTVLILTAALAGLVALMVLRDWGVLGIPATVQITCVAAAVAWLLVVPAGLVTLAFIADYPAWAYATFGLGAGVAIGQVVGPAFCPLGIAVALAVPFLFTSADALLVDQIGLVLVFLSTLWGIREILLQRRIELWPAVELLEPGSNDYKMLTALFRDRCLTWAEKYDFRLDILSVYSVGRLEELEHRSVGAARLFHGTSWSAALAILSNGFRLPKHAGMFGKGIYFADCPQKSWFFSGKPPGLGPCCGRGHLILLCLVNLGSQRLEREANLGLQGYNRRGFWAWLTTQQGAYDSVVGVENDQGGALRAPEYVIYDPARASVACIFEVEKRALDEPESTR